MVEVVETYSNDLVVVVDGVVVGILDEAVVVVEYVGNVGVEPVPGYGTNVTGGWVV